MALESSDLVELKEESQDPKVRDKPEKGAKYSGQVLGQSFLFVGAGRSYYSVKSTSYKSEPKTKPKLKSEPEPQDG